MSICTGDAGVYGDDDNDHNHVDDDDRSVDGEHVDAQRNAESTPETVFGRRPDGQTPGGHIQGGLEQRGIRVVDGPDELERRWPRHDHVQLQGMVQEAGEKK